VSATFIILCDDPNAKMLSSSELNMYLDDDSEDEDDEQELCP
jgi:hypothetical protein